MTKLLLSSSLLFSTARQTLARKSVALRANIAALRAQAPLVGAGIVLAGAMASAIALGYVTEMARAARAAWASVEQKYRALRAKAMYFYWTHTTQPAFLQLTTVNAIYL